jgi:hypothetical protein
MSERTCAKRPGPPNDSKIFCRTASAAADRAEALELLLRVGLVLLRQHPVRRALEQVDAAGALRDLRHELHGARRAADHAHRLAGEIVIPVPPRGVEARAGKRVEARDVGHRDLV